MKYKRSKESKETQKIIMDYISLRDKMDEILSKSECNSQFIHEDQKKIDSLEDSMNERLGEMVEKTWRYCYKLANQMLNSYVQVVASYGPTKLSLKGFDIPIDDLVSEGYADLLKKIDKYDPERRASFTTFFRMNTAQAMNRYGKQQNPIHRIPVHMCDFLSSLRKHSEDHEEAISMICKRYKKISKREADSLYKTFKNQYHSLDQPLKSNEGYSALKDFMVDESEKDGFEVTAENELQERVRTLLGTLSPREEMILRSRFFEEKTLDSIGPELGGLTRERIRQIEEKALRKLRHRMTYKSEWKELRDYIKD